MLQRKPKYDIILDMFSMMVRTREAEERIAVLYSEQEMRLSHSFVHWTRSSECRCVSSSI
jgi:TPP-dependent pyruvate/acetoin dehydrogenase alpha subunit